MTETELRPLDGDLIAAIWENDQALSKIIEGQLAVVPGEADGANWYWLVRMVGGKYAVITAWCTITGWDIGGMMMYTPNDTPEGAIDELADELYDNAYAPGVMVRDELLGQLRGTKPYGVISIHPHGPWVRTQDEIQWPEEMRVITSADEELRNEQASAD